MICAFGQMQGLEELVSEFQDMFGDFKQTQDMLEDVLTQIGECCVLFCSITGEFWQVCGSGLVWGNKYPSSAVCWAPT